MKLNKEKISKFLLDLVFPNRCPVCRRFIKWDKLICDECFDKLPFIGSDEQCVFCGQLHDITAPCTNTHSFDNALSVMRYEGNAKRAMYNFKNRYALNIAEFSVPYIYLKLEDNDLLKEADCITFVPMYSKKEFKRGYNQAEELARFLSRSLDLPVIKGILVHSKTNKRQHDLTAEQRKAAAKSTYSLGRCRWDKSFKTVILTDDIITTGSTLDACASLLKDAGFEKVICVSVCVTPFEKKKDKNKTALE